MLDTFCLNNCQPLFLKGHFSITHSCKTCFVVGEHRIVAVSSLWLFNCWNFFATCCQGYWFMLYGFWCLLFLRHLQERKSRILLGFFYISLYIPWIIRCLHHLETLLILPPI